MQTETKWVIGIGLTTLLVIGGLYYLGKPKSLTASKDEPKGSGEVSADTKQNTVRVSRKKA